MNRFPRTDPFRKGKTPRSPPTDPPPRRGESGRTPRRGNLKKKPCRPYESLTICGHDRGSNQTRTKVSKDGEVVERRKILA